MTSARPQPRRSLPVAVLLGASLTGAALTGAALTGVACGGPQPDGSAPQELQVEGSGGAPGNDGTANTVDQPESADDALHAILDDVWEFYMRAYPTWATYEGDRRYDALLTDISPEAVAERRAQMIAFSERVEAIDSAALSETGADTRAMFMLEVQTGIAVEQCHSEWWDVSGLDGPQTDLPMLPVFHSVRSQDDVDTLAARYVASELMIAQQIDNLRTGMANGYTPTRENVSRALLQARDWLANDPTDEPMMAIQTDEPELETDASVLRDAIEAHVRPAMSAYADFLENELLPVARESAGVGSLPAGTGCYEALVARHIGPGWTADQLHAVGLEQLAWAHAGMVSLSTELGQDADITAHELIDYMRDAESMRMQSSDEVIARSQTAVEFAAAHMHEAFGTLPEAPIEVWPIEAHRAPDAPAAYYYGPPEDGSRPGVYYVNTDSPETRPIYNVEALAYHEAIPGHHLQIAIAGEIPDTHPIRRNMGQTAFVEGWALYAEHLAFELGWYNTPEAQFGMYNYQAWRAARLVVDTGMHAMGWSREQALTYLTENVALPANEAANETDRYITWPGQALAYMVGRLEIEALRAEAQAALGDEFDLAQFHDVVLGAGAIPLPTLRAHIESWISR